MPTIQLDGSPHDPGRVWAVMLFPNNERMREQFFAVHRIRAEVSEAKVSEYFRLDAKALLLLVESPSYEDLERLTAESTKRGTVAGDILGALYLMDKFSVPEPSMNKAIYIAQQFAAQTKYGDGTRMNKSEPRIRQCWQDFKIVAHLWGALRVNDAYPFAQPQTPFSPAEYLTFLEFAAGLQHFGCSFIPKRSKSTVLDPKKSWLLPNSVRPRTLKSDRIPELLLKTLENYKAPKSQL